jgi:hypothetical protein
MVMPGVRSNWGPVHEPFIVNKAAKLPETKNREQIGIAAKRAAAAAELERVAGQHGYTLAQLGLVLQSE